MNDITKTQGSELSAEQLSSWGSSSNLGSDDFKLSSILLMQGTSAMVKDMEHEAKIGEFRDNRTGELLGSIKEPKLFVPFHVEKRWDIEFLKDGKWKWFDSELFSIENSRRPISKNKTAKRIVESTESGDFSYFISYRAFVLLVDDLERDVVKPYVVDFKNSSREAGRILGQTMMQDNKLEKLSPAAYMFKLGAEEISNDESSWLAYTAVRADRTSAEHEVQAFKMHSLVKNMDASEAEENSEQPEPKGHSENDLEF